MNKEMAEAAGNKITVKLRKGGWEVEITCSEPQLKQAIESVLASLNATGQVVASLHPEEVQTGTGNKTCRGLIIELWREGWFSEGKSLAQVHEEIARRGYHYDRTAVSHALRDLVLETILTRQGNSRNYQYIQKRPPGAVAPADVSLPEAAKISEMQEMADEEEEE
jgi:hypothetical protein